MTEVSIPPLTEAWGSKLFVYCFNCVKFKSDFASVHQNIVQFHCFDCLCSS